MYTLGGGGGRRFPTGAGHGDIGIFNPLVCAVQEPAMTQELFSHGHVHVHVVACVCVLGDSGSDSGISMTHVKQVWLGWEGGSLWPFMWGMPFGRQMPQP